MNTWMNSVPYLAAMAHIGWAAWILLAFWVLSGGSMTWELGATGAFLVYAAVKEFWYDANYELPKQTFWDNASDFIGYVGGLAIAWIVIAIKHYA